MTDVNDVRAMHWDYGDWEESLSIDVGSVYRCSVCNNVAMVTKGGLGVLQLGCCGQPMEKVVAEEAGN
jgi:desulfoferrodoxin-like iron-binding protein